MTPACAASIATDKIKAVAINSSWWDIGAATGALTAGMLLSGSLLFRTFVTATFILGLLFIILSLGLKRN